MTLDEQVHRALGKGRTNRYPAYSKSWCHAGKALDEFAIKNAVEVSLGRTMDDGWEVVIEDNHVMAIETADTAPEAICRAIVAAKEKLDV